MPPVKRGQMVTFYEGCNFSDGSPAVVQKVFPGSIEVGVFAPDSPTVMQRTAVRHAKDPRLEGSPDLQLNGAWDYSEQDKELEKLKAKVADLDTAVRAMLKK